MPLQPEEYFINPSLHQGLPHELWSDQQIQLRQQLDDEHFRQTFGEKETSWIGPQIRIVREQRGLSQEELAQLTNTRQSAVSRMENVDYGKWSINKLQQLCKALGCWVEVRLRSYGELVDGLHSHSRVRLQVPSYGEDWRLHPGIPPLPDASSEHVRTVQRAIHRWVLRNRAASPEHLADQLVRWLDGWDLPGVGEDEDPAPLLVAAFTEGSWAAFRLKPLGGALAVLTHRLADWAEIRAPFFSAGVFLLCAKFPNPEAFEAPLSAVLSSIEQGRLKLDHHEGRALVQALKHNQSGVAFLHVWKDVIVGKQPVIPLDLEEALDCISLMPPTLPDFQMGALVAWVATRLNERCLHEAFVHPASRAQSYDRYIALLTHFFRSQKSFRQRPVLVAILAYEFIAVRGIWNKFLLRPFSEVFLSEARQAERILVNAAARHLGTAPIAGYLNAVVMELQRVLREIDVDLEEEVRRDLNLTPPEGINDEVVELQVAAEKERQLTEAVA